MSARVALLACALVACNAAPAATPELFGPRVEPPRGLSKITPGMRVAEARRLVPALHDDPRAVRDVLALDSGVGDVKLEVRTDGDTVASIVAIVSRRGTRELLIGAWGEPQITRDSLGQPEVTWSSEITGWKAKLDCLERNCLIEYLPYHPLSAELFGAHVVPPGELAKLAIGMKVADARALAPGPVDVRAGVPTGVDGVRAFVAIDDQRGTVRAIYVNLPPGAERLIAEAWGDGVAATEPVGREVRVWADPMTRWRAILRPALGSSHDLGFDGYLPVAQLLGEQPDVIDALPVLGLTAAAVKRQFAGRVAGRGKRLVLTLPPTEWARTATRVQLELAGGRVRALAFAIPFKAHPAARDALLELFTHKWGPPREGDDPRTLVFRDADPRVEIREDAAHEAWRLELR